MESYLIDLTLRRFNSHARREGYNVKNRILYLENKAVANIEFNNEINAVTLEVLAEGERIFDFIRKMKELDVIVIS